MTADEVLAELRSLGKEQARKIYARHGARGEILGVSYADLEKLAKRIKVDHALALALWDSGIHDARILATKVADPKLMDAPTLEGWIAGAADHVEADAAAGVAARSVAAASLLERWIASESEPIARAGWSLVGRLALDGAERPDAFFTPHLATIERRVPASSNRIREAMNSALIAIGCRNDALEARALVTAGRVGKVQVDHGDTSCKTPDAAEFIRKTRARHAARKVK